MALALIILSINALAKRTFLISAPLEFSTWYFSTWWSCRQFWFCFLQGCAWGLGNGTNFQKAAKHLPSRRNLSHFEFYICLLVVGKIPNDSSLWGTIDATVKPILRTDAVKSESSWKLRPETPKHHKLTSFPRPIFDTLYMIPLINCLTSLKLDSFNQRVVLSTLQVWAYVANNLHQECRWASSLQGYRWEEILLSHTKSNS